LQELDQSRISLVLFILFLLCGVAKLCVSIPFLQPT
jgi:hypothetical protein